jgi:hypothetical protein
MTINCASYASYEERKEWMEQMTGLIPRKVFLPHALLAEVDLLKEEIKELKEFALNFVAHSLSLSSTTTDIELLSELERRQFKPDRKAHHILIPLEGIVTKLLHCLQLHKRMLGVEYPINVRVVHGTPIKAYSLKKYATTNIHTDLWAGEPADSMQIIIPILGDVKSTRCQWYEPSVEHYEQCVCTSQDYPSALSKLGQLRKISHSFEVGKLYFFDSALPHQTIQKEGGIRLSLDFRLRRMFPYSDIQWLLRMKKERNLFEKYYIFPSYPYPHTSFEQKLDEEITVLKKLKLEEFASFRKQEYL